MKQVVQQPAIKLNEAICGVKGSVPVMKKHITDVEGLLLCSLEQIQDCLSVSWIVSGSNNRFAGSTELDI